MVGAFVLIASRSTRKGLDLRLRRNKSLIPIKTREEIDKMREAGRVVHRILQRCHELAVPGVETRALDAEATRIIQEVGGEGLFKNYPGTVPFPGELCISLNECVVHGIGSDRKIKEGDVVGVDCGVRLNGWCGDSATTIPVGQVDPDVQGLLDATRQSLELAVDAMRPGRKWSEIARLIQQYLEGRGYGVVRDFVGHGVGRNLHERPSVPNFVGRDLLQGGDFVLKPGMVLAVEPMATLGTHKVETLDDHWTVVTRDRKAAAHYEHTVAVVEGGVALLTDGN